MRTLASLGALFCTAILTQSISAATHTDALMQEAAALRIRYNRPKKMIAQSLQLLLAKL